LLGDDVDPTADAGECKLEDLGLVSVSLVLGVRVAAPSVLGNPRAGLTPIELDVLRPGTANPAVQLEQRVLVQLGQRLALRFGDQSRSASVIELRTALFMIFL
jgi:hypothetical protein